MKLSLLCNKYFHTSEMEEDLLREAFDHIWGEYNWSLSMLSSYVHVVNMPDCRIYSTESMTILTVFDPKYDEKTRTFTISFMRNYLSYKPESCKEHP